MTNINNHHSTPNPPSAPYYLNEDRQFQSQQSIISKQQQQQEILAAAAASESSATSPMDHQRMTTGLYNTQTSSLDISNFHPHNNTSSSNNNNHHRQANQLSHHNLHDLQQQQHHYNNTNNQQQLINTSNDHDYLQSDRSNDNGICFMDFVSSSASNNNFMEPDPNAQVPLNDPPITVHQSNSAKTSSNISSSLTPASISLISSSQQTFVPGNNPIDTSVSTNNNNPYVFNQRQSLIFQDHHHQQHHQQQQQHQHPPPPAQYAQQQQQQQQQHLHSNINGQQIVPMGYNPLVQHPSLNSQHHHQQSSIFSSPARNQQQRFNHSTGGGGNQLINNNNNINNNLQQQQQFFTSIAGFQHNDQVQKQRQQQQYPTRSAQHGVGGSGSGATMVTSTRYNVPEPKSSPSLSSTNKMDASTNLPSAYHQQARDKGENWLLRFPSLGGGGNRLTPIESMKNEIYEQLDALLNIVYTNESSVNQSNCKQEEVACSVTTAGSLQKTLRQNQERYKMGEITLKQLEQSRHELDQEQNSFRLAVSEVNNARKQLLRNHLSIFRQLSEIKQKVFAQLNHWIQEQQQGSTNAVYHSVSGATTTTSLNSAAPQRATMTPNIVSSTGIGAQPNNSDYQTYALDLIESQIHLIVDVVNETKAQLGRGAQKWCEEKWARCDEGIIEVGSNLLQKYDRFLEDVIVKSFIVEKQPPQVMKTNTRFSSTCRFLCGNRIPNLAYNPPQVKVTIISENTAKALMQCRHELLRTSWSSMAQQPDLDDHELIRLFDSFTNQHQQPHNNNNNHNQQPQQQQHSACTSPGSAYSPASVPQNLSSPRSNASSIQAVDMNQQQHQANSNIAARSSATANANLAANNGTFGKNAMISNPNVHAKPTAATYHHNHLNDISSNRNLKVIDISRFENCGEIINNTNLIEFNESTRHVTCNFRNMQLKKIKRTEKKSTESVMDEKSILLFSAEFRTPVSANVDNYYQIMAFSLPVVVIVHGNQESHAWATVTWHNAFAKPTEYLYNVPDKVSWFELGQVLSEKFNSCTGRGLNQKNLDFLATKICRTPSLSSSKQQLLNGGRQIEVNWTNFAKELLPDRSFTFWEWFYSMFKLTREHLRELWADDRIYGFIGKKGCIKLLSEDHINMGTFLLRFSEHELGGVTIAYVSLADSTNSTTMQSTNTTTTGTSVASATLSSIANMDNQQSQSPTYGVTPEGNHVCFVHPFVHKDLNTRSLADRLRDLGQLAYLYPTILKNEAFQKYYTPIYDVDETPEGYIKPMLVQLLMKDYPKNDSSANTLIDGKSRADNSTPSSPAGQQAIHRTTTSTTMPAIGHNNNNQSASANTNTNNKNNNYTTDMDLSYNADGIDDDDDDDLT